MGKGEGFVVAKTFGIQGLISEWKLFPHGSGQTGSRFPSTMLCGSYGGGIEA